MCDTHSNKKKTKEEIHEQEHLNWNRRSFLQALGLVGGGTMLLGGTPITASRPSNLASALSQSENENILVLIRLKGGNDGLNTIVPINQYDIYANARPTIKHELNSLYNLSDTVGLPDTLNDLQSLWGNGAMKVALGVGYEASSLSHFRGSDIWASTDANNNEPSGWFGRYFEQQYQDFLMTPPDIPAAVQIGSIGNLIFEGPENNFAFAITNPEQLNSIAQNGTFYNTNNLPDCTYGEQLQFMRNTANSTFNYAETIHNAYSNSINSVEYQNSGLGPQLANVARMIKGNLGTKVYMVTLDGFDTHVDQVALHAEKMNELSNSIKLFFDDLAVTGHDQKVLAMTISEFGRRVQENGSNGTDHGAAAPLLLFGPGLEGNGFIGNYPSLTDLDIDGNLKYNIDFRRIYATIMQEWLCIDANVVNQALLGEAYQAVDLGFNCSSLSINDFNLAETFSHHVLMTDNQTIIKIKNTNTQHVVVKLYNVLGKEITTLKNEMLFPGDYSINVKNEANTRLSTGQYIYRISAGGEFYSKSIIIR